MRVSSLDRGIHQRLHQLAARRRKVAFKRSYRDIDVLLVDDIQFIEGKKASKRSSFHTFQHAAQRKQADRHLSDRPPKQLATLEDRLRTRFEWVYHRRPAPELETASPSCARRRRWSGARRPDDVLELIASSIERNIRELEGALIRVTAFASLNKQPIDKALAEIVLRDLIADAGSMQISAATIMAATAEYFDTPSRNFGAPARPRPGPVPPDRHVPVPRTHRPVTAQDRAGVRSRSHHRHVRPAEDPQRNGLAARGVRPVKSSPPDPSALPSAESGRFSFTAGEKLWAQRYHQIRTELCAPPVDNLRHWRRAPWIVVDKPCYPHRRPGPTSHPQRTHIGTPPPSRSASVSSTHAQPYYYCLSLSLEIPLKVGPGDDGDSQHRPGQVMVVCHPDRLAFKMASDALRLFSDAVPRLSLTDQSQLRAHARQCALF